MKLRRQAAPRRPRRLALLLVWALVMGYLLLAARQMVQRKSRDTATAAANSGGGGDRDAPPRTGSDDDSSSSSSGSASAAIAKAADAEEEEAGAEQEAEAAEAAATGDAPAGGAPKTVCSDTCSRAKDGVCDEGRPNITAGAQQSTSPVQAVHCDLGTDCTDCGPWVRLG